MTQPARGSEGPSVHLQIRTGANGSITLNLFAPGGKDLETLVTELGGPTGEVIIAAAETIQAMSNLAEKFPATQVVEPAPGQPAAPICAHNVPRRRIQGKNLKGSYAGWVCQVENDPKLPKCKPIWDS